MARGERSGLAALLIQSVARSAMADARDAAARGVKAAILALLAGFLLLVAYGLGITAAILETATHIGLVGAIGLWAGITALLAGALAFASSATARRRTVSPRPVQPATSAPPPPGAGVHGRGDHSEGIPGAENYRGDPSYELGRTIGASIPTLPLVGAAVIIGVLLGSRR